MRQRGEVRYAVLVRRERGGQSARRARCPSAHGSGGPAGDVDEAALHGGGGQCCRREREAGDMSRGRGGGRNGTRRARMLGRVSSRPGLRQFSAPSPPIARSTPNVNTRPTS